MFPRLVLLLALIALTAQRPPHAQPLQTPTRDLPRLVLWAWERPEDLRKIPDGVGVAFLAQSIGVSPGRVRVEPRRQPLRVRPSTRLIAVTRLDADPGALAGIDGSTMSTISAAIERTVRMPRVAGIQVDFDARVSERHFYAALLEAVRARIGELPLSITALASWCAADPWIDDLPVDEAVPMLFRMGPLNEPYRRVAATGRWRARRCRGALGASIDEPESMQFTARRVFLFSPRSWSDGAIRDVQTRYER